VSPLAGLALVTLLACTALTVMANATISAALPSLRDHFQATPAIDTVAGLVMTLPSLGVVLTAYLFGRLSDRIGRRPILLAGLVAYALAGVSGLFLESLPAILVGRFLLGCSVGAVMTAATAMGGDYFAGSRRDGFMGLMSMSMSLGGILFMLGGGALAVVSWRTPFAAYGFALLLVPLAWRLLPEAPPPPMVEGTTRAASVMPWRVVLGVAGLAFLSMVLFYLVPVKAPFLLRELGHPNPFVAGLVGATVTVGGVVAGLQFRRLRQRLSEPMLYAASLVLAAGGYLLIAGAWNVWSMALGVFVAGVGFGFTMPNQASWMMAEVPPAQRGAATGILTSAIFLGQFASPLFAGPASALIGLGNTYALAAGVMLLAALVVSTIPGRVQQAA
jgi:MFS family permease